MNATPNVPQRTDRPGAGWIAAGILCSTLSACGGGGGGGSSSATQDQVRVLGVAPGTGPFIGGTAVTLTGRRFDLEGQNTVLFGDHPATSVVVVDETTITCVTPANSPGAIVDVVVTNEAGEGRLDLAFVYATPPAPTSDVNGDGFADLVVSAPADSTGGTNAGAVFVFFGRTQSFQLDGLAAAAADLKLIGQKPGDAFGTCVCVGDVDGDEVTDLVVSACKVDAVGAPDAGAVYVFRGPITGAQQLPAQAASIKLMGSALVAGDEFGTAVEIGDFDGDELADLVVGAPKHDVGGLPDAGCTYVFRGGATLASRSADAADDFVDGLLAGDKSGARIACGDLDGDGLIDLVLGVGGADVQGDVLRHDAGRVYVVLGGDPTDLAQSAIVLDGVNAGDRFGDAVCVADLDGDGQLDLIASAPYEDSGETDSGRVYVFRGGASLASGDANRAEIRLTGIPNSGPIGQALRAGDFDGDSIADLLVAAPEATGLATRDGVVYVFRGGAALASTTVANAQAVLHGTGQVLEAFGSALSAVDVDRDGFADLAASTPRWSGLGRLQIWRGGVGTVGGEMSAVDADVTVTGDVLGGRFGEGIARGQ